MSGTTRRPAQVELHPPLNRAGLASAVAEQSGLPATKAAQAVDAMLGAIENALRHGREVRITGFGTFTLTQRKATTGRNPRTGAGIQIGPTTTVRFKPGKGLKDAVGEDQGG